MFDRSRQTVCQKDAKKDLILIETQTIFENAKLNCNAIGGELFLPKNDSELDRLGYLIDSSKTCPNAILGGKKSNLVGKEIVDIYGQVVNITRWGPNRPNGREIQQCIETTRLYSENYAIDDISCEDYKSCYFCFIPTSNSFQVRGKLPDNFDSKSLYISRAKRYLW